MATFQDLQKAYPDWETFDEEQEDRIEKLKLYVTLATWRIVHLLIS
jgi:hypothetical protein